MTQEQSERVETALVDMMEKLRRTPEALQAVAEAARVLITPDESATVFPPKVRLIPMVGGNTIDTTSPVRGINVEMPERKGITCNEAWELVEKAIWNSDDRTHVQEEFDKLPPLVQKAIGRPEQLYDWNLVFRRGTLRDEVEANFRDAFRSVTEPENRRGKLAKITVIIHVDTTELDAALAKAERLQDILRGIRVGGGTE